jgi:hypothetical protein
MVPTKAAHQEAPAQRSPRVLLYKSLPRLSDVIPVMMYCFGVTVRVLTTMKQRGSSCMLIANC